MACSCVTYAQAPLAKSNGCEMRVIDSLTPMYPSAPTNKDEVLKSPVVVGLVISGDGTVKTVQLKRSCGVRNYDKAVIRAVKKWRYNAVAGDCGERNSTISVTVSPKKWGLVGGAAFEAGLNFRVAHASGFEAWVFRTWLPFLWFDESLADVAGSGGLRAWLEALSAKTEPATIPWRFWRDITPENCKDSVNSSVALFQKHWERHESN
jgi:TonB family protein